MANAKSQPLQPQQQQYSSATNPLLNHYSLNMTSSRSSSHSNLAGQGGLSPSPNLPRPTTLPVSGNAPNSFQQAHAQPPPFFLQRLPSLPDGGNTANFWQMLFKVRSRSLARAKLKQSSQVSALLSGFALVAMVEMDVPANVPVPLLLCFIVITTLLVSVHMIALMISTCILPHVESINCTEERASSYGLLSFDATVPAGFDPTDPASTPASMKIAPPGAYPSISPYERMAFYIDIAWTCSTVIGIFLFILELAFIVWVKFWSINHAIALVSTIILIPVLISLIFFAFHFYQKLVSIRYEFTDKVINELNILADGLA